MKRKDYLKKYPRWWESPGDVYSKHFEGKGWYERQSKKKPLGARAWLADKLTRLFAAL